GGGPAAIRIFCNERSGAGALQALFQAAWVAGQACAPGRADAGDGCAAGALLAPGAAGGTVSGAGAVGPVAVQAAWGMGAPSVARVCGYGAAVLLRALSGHAVAGVGRPGRGAGDGTYARRTGADLSPPLCVSLCRTGG